MKKSVIVGLVAAVLVVSLLLVSSISAKESGNAKIQQKVLDKAQEDGKVGVIVILEDSGKKSTNGRIMSAAADSLGNEKINHRFESMNAFSASLSSEDIEKLQKDGNVKGVYYDTPVSISLQDSVPLINATRTWAVQSNGINLTGKGETICIIDTGVDYTHPDLGNCTPVKLILNGTNESYISESAHPYTNYYDYTWNITKPGYSKIAVHFVNISTETYYDYVEVIDGTGKIVATYSGLKQDLWSPAVSGDTIYVRLKTDELVTGYGFYIDKIVNGTTNTTYDWGNCSKVIGGWDVRNSDPDPIDDNGHGTHCAGIVAANGVTKGVAPEAKIIAMKMFDSTGTQGTTSDMIAAMEWCMNRSSEFNISVISMSLGGGLNNTYCDSSDTLSAAAINAAVAKNISVIVAAGNDGSTTQISYPACVQNAIPVGSSTKADAISSFSNRNALVLLFAPGTDINSTKRNGGYVLDSGTSMATPHVAGAFAIINQFLRASSLTKTPQEIESALNATGKTIYDSGSGLNYSRINVYDAVYWIDSAAPRVVLVNPSVNITNRTASSLNVSFKCNASDNLAMKNLTFYLWNATGTYNQTNKSVSGANGTIELNITNIPQGDYKWNCLAYDLKGNSAYASSNYSISYDIIVPNVAIINPSDGYSATGTTTVNFEYNVTDSVGISSCSLILNNSVSDYNSSAITNGTNTISKSLISGNYTWSVNCTDLAGNVGNSSSRTITIEEAVTVSSGGGGGGGGGGSSSVTYTVAEDKLAEGYTRALIKGDKLKFSVESENHSLTVDYVGGSFANITIMSNATKIVLNSGESVKLNLSSKDYYNLLVKLESIAGGKANITIQSIYEKIQQIEENKLPAEEPDKPAADTSATNKSGRVYTIQEQIGGEGSKLAKYVRISIPIAIIALVIAILYFLKRESEE